jgi:predicted O-linked N-acetylglucosamine transferase (SPINDLY family)
MTQAVPTPSSPAPTPQELARLTSLFGEKRYTEAIAAAESMTARFPQSGFGWKALGVALRLSGHSGGDALAAMQRAAELLPDDAEAHSNLGLNLQEAGRLGEAETHCLRALQLSPDYAEAHFNLALTLEAQGRTAEAMDCYRHAIAARPGYAEAHYNLGVLLQQSNQPNEAEASYRRALQFRPGLARAHNNLANTLITLGRMEEVVPEFRQALELDPSFTQAHSNLIFALDLVDGLTVKEHQAERRRWQEQHGRRLAGAIQPHANSPDPERRLRIGYVSADFYRHSTYFAYSPMILQHDRQAFEVVCYSGGKLEDEFTAGLKQAASQWRSTLGMSDDALAEQIRSDRIDILVDLSGHSAGNRLPVFARKPAPIQLTAWGHATGTGLATMDYFLADTALVPPEERALYAEKVVDLACWGPYAPPEYAPQVSPLPALGGKPFTFGCINRIEKISDHIIGLWGRILAKLPAARLLIKGRGLEHAQNRQQLLGRLATAGITAARVTLLGTSAHEEHLKIFHAVDLVLDPFPHSGGISSADALWMGVPVVTLRGSTVASRITSSYLTTLGMTEWIAGSDEEYVRIALKAARATRALARLRAQLRPTMAASPLGDTLRYTRQTEQTYRSLWKRWCAST